MSIKKFNYYMSMDEKSLASEFRSEFCISAKKGINRSKAIVAMHLKKGGDVSMTAMMKEAFGGVVDSNATKPARIFRELVEMDDKGNTSAECGAGKITEAHFDKIDAITVHIAASAVLSMIEKQHKDDPEGQAPHRENLAQILRGYTSAPEALKLLDVMKAQLKPVPKDGEKNKDKDKDTEGEKEKGLKTATPEDVLAHVSHPAFWTQLLEAGKADPTAAVRLAALAQAVGEAATGAVPILMGFAQVPAAQAA